MNDAREQQRVIDKLIKGVAAGMQPPRFCHADMVGERIVELVRSAGPSGMTIHEVAGELRVWPDSISDLMMALLQEGRLRCALTAGGEKVMRRKTWVLFAV